MEMNLIDGQWAILEPITVRCHDGQMDVSICGTAARRL
jgi:hypothetical protein